MDNIGKVVVIFSLLGVCCLYVVSLLIVPPYVPLDEAALHETAFIRTKGVITDLSVSASGTMYMNIQENQTELLVLINSADGEAEELDLRYGDEIEVKGRVQLYNGRYEIIAPITGIKKMPRGRSNISFVSQIAMRPEAYVGTRISVVGYADDIFKRVFYLGDAKGRYRMRVEVGDTPLSELRKEDKIIADGIFVYNAENMRYELNLISLKCSK